MKLSPDEIVYFSIGALNVSATLVYTWIVMAVLVGLSVIVRSRLRAEPPIGRMQLALESIIFFVLGQIREVARQEPQRYLPFVATLFLFILACNVLAIVPGFHPPTGSLATTAALALAVFFAVPAFGIRQVGLRRYLRTYVQPVPLMLPFTVLGEITRTLALAVRLFGNVMSSSMMVAILLVVAPLVFPVLMQVLGLLMGALQAYIFAVLALVYIAAGMAESGKRLSTGESV